MSHLGLVGSLNESAQYEWNISNYFSLSATKGSSYTSPSFIFANISWHLTIYPGGKAEAKSGYLSLFLENESKHPCYATCTIGIKKVNGILLKMSGSGRITAFAGYENFYDRSLLQENASQLVPSGILTIICNLKLDLNEKHETTEEEEMVKFKQIQTAKTSELGRFTELNVLSENLRALSENEESCDVTLQVKDKEFKAHKAILMARSPVFAAMFQHDTSEKQTGFVNIPDCDPGTFQMFLQYVYCGKVEDISPSSAIHLYSISNKYDIQELQSFCIQYLMKSLTADNVCEIVIFADLYDKTELLSAVQDFFTQNFSKIVLTTEWENFLINNARLANKLLIEMSKNKGCH